MYTKRVSVCLSVAVCVHGYFLEAADSRRRCVACEWYEGVPLHWGMHPQPLKSVPVTCTRHVHTITYGRMLVCAYMCNSTRFCARPCVQQSVLCHTVYRGQWPWRAHWACPTTLGLPYTRTAVKNHENSADGARVHTAIALNRRKRMSVTLFLNFRYILSRGLTFFL